MKDAYLVIDAKNQVFHCKCCGEKYPLGVARMTTVIKISQAFMEAHDEYGCSQEKYDKQKLVEEL